MIFNSVAWNDNYPGKVRVKYNMYSSFNSLDNYILTNF